jgi:hypothetical protein
MQLHIQYVRSLDDSARVRAACVKFLQNSLLFFYPERADIVEQATQLAETLDGRLQTPVLSWKYSWIRQIFGWTAAKRAQVAMPKYKWSLIRSFDKALFLMKNQNSQP